MNEQDYDQVTDVATEDYAVATEDYWLRFRVPPGLMPDSQFDDRPARLQVHRVRPVYENGKGPSERRAVVLIHGRTVPGPVVFDLRDPATGGDLKLSVQEALARASTPSPRACSATVDRRGSVSTIPAMRASVSVGAPRLDPPRGATAP